MPGSSSLLGCFIGSFLIIFFLIARFVFKVYRFMHKARKAARPHFQQAEEVHDDANRKRKGSKDSRYNNQDPNGDGNPQGKYYKPRNHTSNNEETIIDHRDPAKTNKKIFSDDEGEYINYEEER